MNARSLSGLLLKLEDHVVKGELYVIVGGLALILACIALNVVVRVFAMPWPDVSEPALICMSLLAFIGGAYAVRYRGHIAIELIHGVAGGALSRICSICVDVAILMLSALLVYYGYDFFDYVYSMDERTVELRVPLSIPVGSMLLGGLLSAFHVLCGWLRRWVSPAPIGLDSEGAT